MDEILNLIESVSEDFPSYSLECVRHLKYIHAHLNQHYTVLILINVPEALHFKRGGILKVKSKLGTNKTGLR